MEEIIEAITNGNKYWALFGDDILIYNKNMELYKKFQITKEQVQKLRDSHVGLESKFG